MSSTNFAAAQERVLERRRLREAEARARLADQQRTSPVNSAAVQRLPYPLSRLTGSGWALWSSIKGRDGTRPAFRVGQVDAELLDEELLDLLKGQVGEALKYFGVCPLETILSGIFAHNQIASNARGMVSRDSVRATSDPLQTLDMGS